MWVKCCLGRVHPIPAHRPRCSVHGARLWWGQPSWSRNRKLWTFVNSWYVWVPWRQIQPFSCWICVLKPYWLILFCYLQSGIGCPLAGRRVKSIQDGKQHWLMGPVSRSCCVSEICMFFCSVCRCSVSYIKHDQHSALFFAFRWFDLEVFHDNCAFSFFPFFFFFFFLLLYTLLLSLLGNAFLGHVELISPETRTSSLLRQNIALLSFNMIVLLETSKEKRIQSFAFVSHRHANICVFALL